MAERGYGGIDFRRDGLYPGLDWGDRNCRQPLRPSVRRLPPRKNALEKQLKKLRFSLIQTGQIIGASCVSLLGIGLFSLTLMTGS